MVERYPSKVDVTGSSPVARFSSDHAARLLPDMRTAAKIRACELRAIEGRSIKEIARIVGASQSSVSVWVRDVAIEEKQRQALREHARVARRTERFVSASSIRAGSAHFR